MRMVQDRGVIARLLLEYGLPEMFDCEKLSFHVRTYEKGEQISSPGTSHHAFLFLREEDVRLGTYFESGSYVTVDMPGLPLLVLGDFEFAMGGTSMFWAEARTDIQALCLPFEENRLQLRRDPDFLFFLLTHVTAKALLGRTPHVLQSFPLRDRVLSAMRSAPDGVLRGINETAARLDCSSRQLLRVLNDLIQDGLIEKTGRGCYRLTDGGSLSSSGAGRFI